jgi:hypothetical protein
MDNSKEPLYITHQKQWTNYRQQMSVSQEQYARKGGFAAGFQGGEGRDANPRGHFISIVIPLAATCF